MEKANTSADRAVAGSALSSEGSDEGGSAPQQVKEVVQEGAEMLQDKAQELKGTAGERVRQELDTRSTQAGTQLQGTAAAMRRTTEQLRQEGNEGPARAMDFLAERAERLGSYLAGANADQVLRDVEGFARRQPWLATVGGATVGFFAARFLKASSSARYHSGSTATRSRPTWSAEESPGARRAIDSDAVVATEVEPTGAQPVLTSPRGGSNG
jgi:ElaB/YqjD/DUF883 family membrane-anchored ribosome-binding protein